jgi:hypothetical protein
MFSAGLDDHKHVCRSIYPAGGHGHGEGSEVCQHVYDLTALCGIVPSID